MHVGIVFSDMLSNILAKLWVTAGDETPPDSKAHGAHIGPTWGQQDPGGPHAGHVNLAVWN